MWRRSISCWPRAAADPHDLSDDELLAAAKATVRLEAKLAAAQSHVLAELEVRGVCDREFGSSTGAWVANETNSDRAVMAGRVRVAARLRCPLDQVDAAWSDGRIGVEHVRALVRAANPRVLDQVAETQGEW